MFEIHERLPGSDGWERNRTTPAFSPWYFGPMPQPRASDPPNPSLRPYAALAVAFLALAAVVFVAALAREIAVRLGADLPVTVPVEGLPAGRYAGLASLMSFSLLAVSGTLALGLRGPIRAGWSRRDHPIVAGAAVAVIAVNLIGFRLMSEAGEAYRGAPVPDGIPTTTAFVLVAVLLAPAAEELFFRELLLARVLASWRRAPAVLFSSAAFGLVHFDFGGVVLLLTVTAMGLVLGWVRERTGSLGAAVVVHIANNAFALAAPRLTRMIHEAAAASGIGPS